MLLWVCIGLPVQAWGALVVPGGGALTRVRSPFEINCDLDGLFSVCMQTCKIKPTHLGGFLKCDLNEGPPCACKLLISLLRQFRVDLCC